MERHSNRIGLGVIPRFIFAGLLSSAYNLIALRKSELHEGANQIITVLVGGLCLGLFLVAALWFYERLDSWKSAALLIAIMVMANGFSLLDQYVPESLRQDNLLPLLGITDRDGFRLFLPTCLVAILGFAIVLLGTRNALRTVPIAFGFSVLATLVFNYQVVQGRSGWLNMFPGEVLGILWQMILVFSLAFTLWSGQISLRVGHATVQDSRVHSVTWARNGLISLGILIGIFFSVQLWTSALIREERKRDAEHLAQIRAVFAYAPSRDNLPRLIQESSEDVLPQIAGCTRYWPHMNILSAETVLPALETTTSRALYPERYSYTTTYADTYMLNTIPVNVTTFPTADWANYYVKPTTVLYTRNVWKLMKFGNNIHQIGTSFVWPSDNKVIFLDCQLAKQPMIDELLKTYLQKYPSSE